MYRYYRKWLRDSRGGKGNPDWDGDQVLLPWWLYSCYGDTAILRENFDAMKNYVDTVRNRTPGLIYREGYGDWCAPNQGTWESYFSNVAAVNTAVFFQCAEAVANSATILNDDTAMKKYRALADSIRLVYNAAFFHPEKNTYGNGSQTEDILPLALNITPQDRKEKVAGHLAHTILKEKDGHLDTGIPERGISAMCCAIMDMVIWPCMSLLKTPIPVSGTRSSSAPPRPGSSGTPKEE